jgi:hypothetical protein
MLYPWKKCNIHATRNKLLVLAPFEDKIATPIIDQADQLGKKAVNL